MQVVQHGSGVWWGCMAWGCVDGEFGGAVGGTVGDMTNFWCFFGQLRKLATWAHSSHRYKIQHNNPPLCAQTNFMDEHVEYPHCSPNYVYWGLRKLEYKQQPDSMEQLVWLQMWHSVSDLQQSRHLEVRVVRRQLLLQLWPCHFDNINLVACVVDNGSRFHHRYIQAYLWAQWSQSSHDKLIPACKCWTINFHGKRSNSMG